ncbi:pseudouridylate synthase-like protein 3 [Dendryphion nanum]|uniref:Pseudouridylate synthase-like protein 3 n=1 Tax=Dendryphion nanum TaxID=256645 RepID=A0A9P9E1Q2_9PLEO|nr:pseudouridylate synthase-like protein 3 [Dendryphion nanum]
MAGRAGATSDYARWSQEQLIARIQDLEGQLHTKLDIQHSEASSSLRSSNAFLTSQKPLPYRKPPKQAPKPFDPSKYNTRLIALKFAYLGQKYNGFEHHRNNTTPLPTIEEELWKAMVKTRLINPIPNDSSEEREFSRLGKKTFETWERGGANVNWDGCEYSKCGRTDRGVSAFGQVIGIKVRSNKPLPKSRLASRSTSPSLEDQKDGTQPSVSAPIEQIIEEDKAFDDLKDELPYIQLLNRVLPPDIRVYAWCPKPPSDFSARFSCKERRYKYFFTNPCFTPVPGPQGIYEPAATGSNPNQMREGWLNIDAMKQGCRELIGLHDFRNFCKIDASKQLTNFQRRIFHADIEEISPLALPSFLQHPSLQNPQNDASPQEPKLYSFTLHGSAFLWHQVRSIVAILFLIGQGLESPSLIPHLLDISSNPTRPKYEMASDAPLVLWDCIFPHEEEIQSAEQREHGYEDRLEWVYVGDEGGIEPKSKNSGANIGRGKWGRGGVIDDVWEVWRGNKIEETLSSLLLDTIAAQGKSRLGNEMSRERAGAVVNTSPRLFDGADVGRAKGRYIPVLNRERQEPVEVVNERYAKRKGLDANGRKPREEDADE